VVGRTTRLVGGLFVGAALTGCAVAPAPAPIPPVASPSLLTPYSSRHTGIDLRVPAGTPVLAAADGEVRLVADGTRAGRTVIVAHGPDLATVYMHLSAAAVHAGQVVRRGEVVGRSGRTGNATTPHLHFAVCRRPRGQCGAGADGGWDDPARYWVAGDACFEGTRDYGEATRRLTYPLPCRGG
jgi:Peptidase family M23